jgi:uncharacterized protein YukE
MEMSDYVVSVNFAALSEAAAALRAKASLFDQQVELANTAVAPLRDTWVNSGSDAAVRYDDYWNKLKTAAQQIFADVDKLGRAINSAQETQAANELKYAAQFE